VQREYISAKASIILIAGPVLVCVTLSHLGRIAANIAKLPELVRK
jgi:hypothetical protein